MEIVRSIQVVRSHRQTTMDRERVPYMSFLLRIWLEDGGDLPRSDQLPGEWQASLQYPHTQEASPRQPGGFVRLPAPGNLDPRSILGTNLTVKKSKHG